MQVSCAPEHHSQGVQTGHALHAPGHAHVSHPSHAMKAAAIHQHAMQDDAGTADSSAYCSACVICSASALALPSAAVPAFVEFASGLAIPAPAPLLASVVPAGLERPPKAASI